MTFCNVIYYVYLNKSETFWWSCPIWISISSSFGLEHVEDKLALHSVLDKFVLGDVPIPLLIHRLDHIKHAGSQEILVLLNAGQSETRRLRVQLSVTVRSRTGLTWRGPPRCWWSRPRPLCRLHPRHTHQTSSQAWPRGCQDSWHCSPAKLKSSDADISLSQTDISTWTNSEKSRLPLPSSSKTLNNASARNVPALKESTVI